MWQQTAQGGIFRLEDHTLLAPFLESGRPFRFLFAKDVVFFF